MKRALPWLALLPLGGPAVAAQPAPVAPVVAAPDPAALAAARRLIVATDMQQQLRAVVPQVVDAVTAQARGTFKAKAMPDELQAKIQVAVHENIAEMTDAFTPAVQDQLALVYARNFSAADLNHLADMLADPVMVRFRAGTPALLKESLPIIMAALAPKQQQFQKRIAGIVADWLRDHPADRSLLARPVTS